MHPAGFKRGIPASDRPQILVLERSATGVACLFRVSDENHIDTVRPKV